MPFACNITVGVNLPKMKNKISSHLPITKKWNIVYYRMSPFYSQNQRHSVAAAAIVCGRLQLKNADQTASTSSEQHGIVVGQCL